MECEVKGEKYLSTEIAPAGNLQLMTAAAVQMLIDIQEELDFAKEQSEQMKEGLKNAMIEKNNGDANEEWQELYRELERTKVPEEQILKRYGVKSLSELDEVSRKRALNGLKRTKSAA